MNIPFVSKSNFNEFHSSKDTRLDYWYSIIKMEKNKNENDLEFWFWFWIIDYKSPGSL